METETPSRSRPSLLRWLMPLFSVVALVMIAIVVILALLGPTIGNIFSNVSKGLSRDGGGGGGVGYSGPSVVMSDPGRTIASTVPPPVNQQPLNPMKAGEINDNAEWDTYTEYRRLYLSRYPSSSIIDFDVTGRRMIKVVDAEGHPIMGARVEVFVDSARISDTLTYATGLTLFFPNADDRSKRHDEFQVVVSVDGHQMTKIIDMRSLGDVFEIRFPLVMVQNDNALYLATFTPVVIPSMTWTSTPTSTSTPYSGLQR
jgi:hypothetical protein